MMSFLTLGEIMARLPEVDDSDVLQRLAGDRALRAALELFRPVNWHGSGIPAERLLEISANDGIPLAWVPPTAIVRDIGKAISRDARVQLLEANEEPILVLCEELVAECTDPWVQDVAPLAVEALAAWRAGYEAAATALAVCVADPLVIWAAEIRHLDLHDDEAAYEEARSLAELEKKRRRYPRAVRRSKLPDDPSAHLVPNLAVLAPIGSFLTRWWPDEDDPPPEGLSRHVVAHQPSAGYFDRPNGLIALMLTTSLLREQQAHCEDVRADDALADMD